MATLNDTALGSDDTSGTSLATADALSVTAGDLIVVGFKHEGTASTDSCSDGVDTYSSAVAATLHTNGDLVGAIFYTTATTTGTRTITCSTAASRPFRKVKAYSFTPAGGKTLQLGNTAQQNQTATASPSAGSASATAAGVAVAFFHLYGAESMTPGSGWTEAAEFNLTDAQTTEYQLQTGAGSLTGDGNFGAGSEDSVSQMAIFNEADAGGGTALDDTGWHPAVEPQTNPLTVSVW